MNYQNFGRKLSKDEVIYDELNPKNEEERKYIEMLDFITDKAEELSREIDEQIYFLHGTHNSTELEKGEQKIIDALYSKINEFKDKFNEVREIRQSPASQPNIVNAQGSDMRLDESLDMRKERTFPREAQEWMYILIGRLLHPIGDKDDWQIIPLIVGRAGTGKSLIANTVKRMFSTEDVGILSSNQEKKFGIEPLENKLIWVMTELKRDLALNAADFQSMVSGEDVSIPRKNKIASKIRWRAPGLLCGNERPGWIDAQGSIARRIAIFNFKQFVNPADVNPELELLLKKELATLILKCNIAYIHTTTINRGKGIWEILPEYFKNERRILQISTDVVTAAVHDKTKFKLWIDIPNNPEERNEWYVKLNEIEEAYVCHWRSMRGTHYPEPFTAEKYETCFNEAALDCIEDDRINYDNPDLDVETGIWVIGIKKV